MTFNDPRTQARYDAVKRGDRPSYEALVGSVTDNDWRGIRFFIATGLLPGKVS